MTIAPLRVAPRGVDANVGEGTISWKDGRAALFGALAVIPLAASNGGYWPTAWNWAAIAFLWVAAIALVLSTASIGRLELVMLASLSALLVWTGLSSWWSSDVGQTVLETERGMSYLVALAAAFLVVRGSAYRSLLLGIWAAIAIVCGYALLTRLMPEHLGVYDPIAGYRLAEPVGYWNGLGVFAAIGSVFALGIAAHARSSLLAAVAAASLLLTIPTVYFTFSRGAWIALAAGLAAAFAFDPRRLRLATVFLVLAPFPALAVWRASEARGLTHLDSSLALASHDGHRLAGLLVALAVAAAFAAIVFAFLRRRLAFSVTTRRVYAACLVGAIVAATAVLFAHYGSPATLARKGYHSFTQSSPAAGTDLNQRLFTLASPRRTIWDVALDDARAHPVLGSGAGSFERFWLEHRPNGGKVRDAHSLYLETLAELGPFGLALLVVALSVPVVAAIRCRRRSLVASALGGYVAFLLHAGIDWDWEMPAVVMAGLLGGAAIVLSARSAGLRFQYSAGSRSVGLALALVLAAFAFVGLLGNRALSAANDAAEHRRPAQEETQARKAMRWAPWSSEGRRLLAESQYARGNVVAARKTLREALAEDANNWELWFNLAAASPGRARVVALRSARRLNPLSPELDEYVSSLGRSP
jgi:O-antigen ligase